MQDGDKSLAQQERIGVIRAIDEDLVVAAARSEHLGHFVRAAVGDRDDVMGRARAYEAIVKGDPMPQPGIPESLNVLLHELKGLGLSVNLE